MKKPNATSIIPRKSLQAEVVTRLRDEIVAGTLKPGTRMQEQALSERYGISRSPLREAFNVLASEDLLTLMPNRGAVVSTPTLEAAEQHFDLLVMLECRGIELACKRATKQQLDEIAKLHERMCKAADAEDRKAYFELNNRIHRAIMLASNNDVLARYHQMVVRQVVRVQNLYGITGENPRDSIVEHERFIRALLKGNAAKALAALQAHLGTADRMLHSRLRAKSHPLTQSAPKKKNKAARRAL
ncbi:MAG: GntR family transcriptional regulator [Rhodobacteraceae bacterium]|nr:GntR family transcriptional regulator [Paracoccaceae bacterium]